MECKTILTWLDHTHHPPIVIEMPDVLYQCRFFIVGNLISQHSVYRYWENVILHLACVFIVLRIAMWNIL